jgi:uncharacterized protein (TIGR02172 family)
MIKLILLDGLSQSHQEGWFNMDLNSPFATGFTAEIYAWKEGWVLKLFNLGISRATVEVEASAARLVYASGLPVPAVGEEVEMHGRFGLEYERVQGVSMLQTILQKPWRFVAYARKLAELQAEIHKIKLPELPSQKDRLEIKIRRTAILPENVRQAALQALQKVPDQDWLCHGDFHPGNVLIGERGPVIIDWLDGSHGSPVMDVARSSLLFGGGPLPEGTPWVVRVLQGRYYQLYLARYRQLHPFDRKEMAEWVPVAAAARLFENIRYDEKRLLSLANRLVE